MGQTRSLLALWILGAMVLMSARPATAQSGASGAERLRVIIETDAGGDPDDEQSLVRFLLYANEWDVEGIIANRPVAREGENLNVERTGLGIVRAHLRAYGECQPNLAKHDSRYPTVQSLMERTFAGYGDTDAGVNLIVAAVDRPDPRPVWFMNWGTDHGSAESALKRALDRILAERGQEGYAKFKSRLRLSGADEFGGHTWEIKPAFNIWVDTLQPELEGHRWYHQFSRLTARAGGFDQERDMLRDHGPLGALYPTNSGPPQKEGDTMMFLYLVPTGMNEPSEPTWGSWAGRYGSRDNAEGRPYYWANGADEWQGTTHRDNSLARWAEDLQNDFKARLDWCVTDFAGANHPPVVRLKGERQREVAAGQRVALEARESSDPDGQALRYGWFHYAEPGSYRGPAFKIEGADTAGASFIAPDVSKPETVHLILTVTDTGAPALSRYARLVVTVRPQ